MLPELACVKEWGAQLESQAVTQFPIRTATKLSGSQHSRQNSSSWFYYHREFLFIFFWLCCLYWRCVTTTKSVWHAMDVGLTQINAGKVQTAAAKLYGKPSTTPTKTKMKSRLRKCMKLFPIMDRRWQRAFELRSSTESNDWTIPFMIHHYYHFDLFWLDLFWLLSH